MDNLILSKNAYYNIVRSIIEEPAKESTGYLIGKKDTKLKIYNAYPVQTAIREKGQVRYGNYNAIERIRRLEDLWDNGMQYLGGFHSHIKNKRHSDHYKLSREDLDFIEKELKQLKKEKWIEIVIRIETKQNLRLHLIEEKIKEKGKKLQSRIYDASIYNYDLVFSSYLVDKNLHVKQLKTKLQSKK